jgi:hypothetical protein
VRGSNVDVDAESEGEGKAGQQDPRYTYRTHERKWQLMPRAPSAEGLTARLESVGGTSGAFDALITLHSDAALRRGEECAGGSLTLLARADLTDRGRARARDREAS